MLGERAVRGGGGGGALLRGMWPEATSQRSGQKLSGAVKLCGSWWRDQGGMRIDVPGGSVLSPRIRLDRQPPSVLNIWMVRKRTYSEPTCAPLESGGTQRGLLVMTGGKSRIPSLLPTSAVSIERSAAYR